MIILLGLVYNAGIIKSKNNKSLNHRIRENSSEVLFSVVEF